MKKVFVSFLILAAVSCKKNPEKFVNDISDSTQKDQASSPASKEKVLKKEESLKKNNEAVIQLLHDKNYRRLAGYIHPEKGVRFSMYAYVNPEEDKVFSASDFLKYLPAKTLFTWGAMDGSGDLYRATLNRYLSDWVYAKDFTAAQVSLDEFQGKGNSLNNLKQVYPKADFTENFIKGSAGNSEMDWKCLRLVFEEFQGKYYLVGIINDQWTI
ncbi:hypothetical protein [uncultured Chryseobacterium sp.]|uniref:hypothetical protein n=1 Tax=uncultured Chryseobacterium sp. TaxID=259322 RepID=UPI0025E681AC|nr:hypothetical protein [uncultured Chryseobacterium sp.]